MTLITCEECLHKVVCPICFSYKDVLNVKDYCEHFVEKSALEKQIPKKPIDDRYPWCVCPACGGSVYLKNIQERIMISETTYCEHCGQALDWGESE